MSWMNQAVAFWLVASAGGWDWAHLLHVSQDERAAVWRRVG